MSPSNERSARRTLKTVKAAVRSILPTNLRLSRSAERETQSAVAFGLSALMQNQVSMDWGQAIDLAAQAALQSREPSLRAIWSAMDLSQHEAEVAQFVVQSNQPASKPTPSAGPPNQPSLRATQSAENLFQAMARKRWIREAAAKATEEARQKSALRVESDGKVWRTQAPGYEARTIPKTRHLGTEETPVPIATKFNQWGGIYKVPDAPKPEHLREAPVASPAQETRPRQRKHYFCTLPATFRLRKPGTKIRPDKGEKSVIAYKNRPEAEENQAEDKGIVREDSRHEELNGVHSRAKEGRKETPGRYSTDELGESGPDRPEEPPYQELLEALPPAAGMPVGSQDGDVAVADGEPQDSFWERLVGSIPGPTGHMGSS